MGCMHSRNVKPKAVVLFLVAIATVSARHRPQKWLKRQRHGGLKCDTHNTNPTCLKAAQVCDGRRDCIDGSDEKNCPSDPPTTCPPPTMCPSSTAFPPTTTCPPPSPSTTPSACPPPTSCPPPTPCTTPPFLCNPGEFLCNDGVTCLPASNICDDNSADGRRKKRVAEGYDDVIAVNCSDKEDEDASICEAKCPQPQP